MEAEKTLTNDELIQELLGLLKKNSMKSEANDVFEICSYVDSLEKKLNVMTEELFNVKQQLKDMQDNTILNNLKKEIQDASEQLQVRCNVSAQYNGAFS
jgi:pantothenate kinase type III